MNIVAIMEEENAKQNLQGSAKYHNQRAFVCFAGTLAESVVLPTPFPSLPLQVRR